MAVNLGLAGLAVLVGVIMLTVLKMLAPLTGGIVQKVILVFPVFPLALLGSLLIRFVLEAVDQTSFVSQLLQREIGTLATDLLITTAMASLNLPLLLDDWLPLKKIES